MRRVRGAGWREGFLGFRRLLGVSVLEGIGSEL